MPPKAKSKKYEEDTAYDILVASEVASEGDTDQIVSSEIFLLDGTTHVLDRLPKFTRKITIDASKFELVRQLNLDKFVDLFEFDSAALAKTADGAIEMMTHITFGVMDKIYKTTTVNKSLWEKYREAYFPGKIAASGKPNKSAKILPLPEGIVTETMFETRVKTYDDDGRDIVFTYHETKGLLVNNEEIPSIAKRASVDLVFNSPPVRNLIKAIRECFGYPDMIAEFLGMDPPRLLYELSALKSLPLYIKAHMDSSGFALMIKQAFQLEYGFRNFKELVDNYDHIVETFVREHPDLERDVLHTLFKITSIIPMLNNVSSDVPGAVNSLEYLEAVKDEPFVCFTTIPKAGSCPKGTYNKHSIYAFALQAVFSGNFETGWKTLPLLVWTPFVRDLQTALSSELNKNLPNFDITEKSILKIIESFYQKSEAKQPYNDIELFFMHILIKTSSKFFNLLDNVGKVSTFIESIGILFQQREEVVDIYSEYVNLAMEIIKYEKSEMFCPLEPTPYQKEEFEKIFEKYKVTCIGRVTFIEYEINARVTIIVARESYCSHDNKAIEACKSGAQLFPSIRPLMFADDDSGPFGWDEIERRTLKAICKDTNCSFFLTSPILDGTIVCTNLLNSSFLPDGVLKTFERKCDQPTAKIGTEPRELVARANLPDGLSTNNVLSIFAYFGINVLCLTNFDLEKYADVRAMQMRNGDTIHELERIEVIAKRQGITDETFNQIVSNALRNGVLEVSNVINLADAENAHLFLIGCLWCFEDTQIKIQFPLIPELFATITYSVATEEAVPPTFVINKFMNVLERKLSENGRRVLDPKAELLVYLFRREKNSIEIYRYLCDVLGNPQKAAAQKTIDEYVSLIVEILKKDENIQKNFFTNLLRQIFLQEQQKSKVVLTDTFLRTANYRLLQTIASVLTDDEKVIKEWCQKKIAENQKDKEVWASKQAVNDLTSVKCGGGASLHEVSKLPMSLPLAQNFAEEAKKGGCKVVKMTADDEGKVTIEPVNARDLIESFEGVLRDGNQSPNSKMIVTAFQETLERLTLERLRKEGLLGVRNSDYEADDLENRSKVENPEFDSDFKAAHTLEAVAAGIKANVAADVEANVEAVQNANPLPSVLEIYKIRVDKRKRDDQSGGATADEITSLGPIVFLEESKEEPGIYYATSLKDYVDYLLDSLEKKEASIEPTTSNLSTSGVSSLGFPIPNRPIEHNIGDIVDIKEAINLKEANLFDYKQTIDKNGNIQYELIQYRQPVTGVVTLDDLPKSPVGLGEGQVYATTSSDTQFLVGGRPTRRHKIKTSSKRKTRKHKKIKHKKYTRPYKVKKSKRNTYKKK